MKVRDVVGGTSRAVVTIDPQHTIADTVYLLKEHAIGAVVVSSDDRTILGIISERDVVRHLVLEHEGTLRVSVEDLMTEQVSTCQLDDEIEEAMEVMTVGHFRHLPIVTAQNELCGIVSLGDLVDTRLRELEAQNSELRQAGAD